MNVILPLISLRLSYRGICQDLVRLWNQSMGLPCQMISRFSLFKWCTAHSLALQPTWKEWLVGISCQDPSLSTNTALPTGPLDVTTTLELPSPAKYWFSLKKCIRFTWICGCVSLLINLQKLGVASENNTVSEWRIVLRCFLGSLCLVSWGSRQGVLPP